MWNAKAAVGVRERLDEWYPPFAPMATGPERVVASTVTASLTCADEPPAPAGGPGPLDYVDDLLGPPKSKARPRKRRNTKVYAGAAAVVALLIGGIAVAAAGLFSGGNDGPQVAASEMTPEAASSETAGEAPIEWCPTGVTDQLVTGAGKGSQDDGASVILAFDYAYYVQRDGAVARGVMDPADPTSLTAESLQNAIDTAIPAGTQHCLSIVPDRAVAGRYSVQLSERRPDGTTVVYKQAVTTANHAGKHVITAIDPVE